MGDKIKYTRWFELARKDLNGANILFEHDTDYSFACFHCEQALEKYLKAI